MKHAIILWSKLLIFNAIFVNVAFSQDSIPNKLTDTISSNNTLTDTAKKIDSEAVKPVVRDTIEKPVIQEKLELFDKIIKYNGDSILGKITDKNVYEIEFIPKGTNKKVKISTSNVKEIYYANGKYELIDTTPEKKKKDWVVSSKTDSSLSEFQITRNVAYDKIVKQNGDTIFCTITDKNLYEIEYLKPKSKYKTKIGVTNIKEIFYSDGKYELIDNNPEKKKKDWVVATSEVEWKAVSITYKAEDVAGMLEKGAVDALFEAKKMNTDNETLERSAFAVMKKKAYSMKATIILITVKNITRAYGEIPYIEVKGIAYGKE